MELCESGYADPDQQPFGPPLVSGPSGGLVYAASVGELEQGLWEEYLDDTTSDGHWVCLICEEIVDRSLPLDAQAAHARCVDYHCVGCGSCLRGSTICTSCWCCRACAVGQCEDVVERWNRALRRREDLWFEDHHWYQVAA